MLAAPSPRAGPLAVALALTVLPLLGPYLIERFVDGDAASLGDFLVAFLLDIVASGLLLAGTLR